ncbi:MAG: peptide ABC transporter substrate-binding protein, partial [Steroidobacteraceae bacterium]
MSPRRTPRLAALLAAVAAGLLAGCARQPDAADHPVSMLVRGGGPDPDSLDPQKVRGFEAQSIVRDLCEGLTTLDRGAAVAPGVAESWSVSADGKVYTFRLRPNARWSSGERVVAADFVAGLRRLTDPATASAYAQYVDVIANANDIVAGRKPPATLGVTAADDSTLVITLATPALYLPALLSHPSTCPVYRPALSRDPAGYARAGVMVSDGAFVLKEWVPGSYVLITRNPSYWNNAATRLDAVKYLIIPDENAELARYRGGELEVTAVVPRGQFDWIKANLAAELHVSPQLSTYYYGFNLRRAPFKDQPKLRRALSLVIDREKLAQLVLRVGELPAYGWVPPGVDNYSSQSFDYRGEPIAKRIAEAQRLYREAGYSREHRLSFELRYNSGEVHTKLALAVASMWKEALGVDVRLVQEEFKTLLADIDRGDVEMFRSSWVGDYNDAYT